MGKFIRLRLYPELREGAELVGVFNKLEVYLLSNEAIILFKSITERERDLDDIAAIIESRQVDWERLMRMAVEVTERELGDKGSRGIVMVYELFVTLQCIEEKHPGLVPRNVLEKLEKLGENYLRRWLELTRGSLSRS